MKVFVIDGFTGNWPVGTAAVIVATDLIAAVSLLDAKLTKSGLPPCDPEMIREINTDRPDAYILCDGDY